MTFKWKDKEVAFEVSNEELAKHVLLDMSHVFKYGHFVQFI